MTTGYKRITLEELGRLMALGRELRPDLGHCTGTEFQDANGEDMTETEQWSRARADYLWGAAEACAMGFALVGYLHEHPGYRVSEGLHKLFRSCTVPEARDEDAGRSSWSDHVVAHNDDDLWSLDDIMFWAKTGQEKIK